MTAVVIDSSVVLEWLLDNPREPGIEGKLIRHLIELKIKVTAPKLLLLEIVNALYWRHHLTLAKIKSLVNRLEDLGVEYVESDDLEAHSLIILVNKSKLTAYDAWYLLAAREMDGVLITHDKELLQADKKRCMTAKQYLERVT